ncbi:MAG: radical SAM protein, partial [Elusimicrobiota bacterium]|nr:radical SAM protein [Elusimicrobiota bacterium]
LARAGAARASFVLILDCGEASPLLPAFRLRRPAPPEVAELASALCLLLESLRGRSGGPAPARAETHERGEGSPERILRVTYACNQRCPFCFLPHGGRPVALADVERQLDALAPELGAGGTLTLSGGEPAADPRLVLIISAARRRGLRRFALQTNAVALSRPALLDRLISLGVSQYDVSFHSCLPATYDRLTGSRGLYPKAAAGLSALLARPGCATTVCVLINALNYRELPHVPRFLAGLARARGRRAARPPELAFSLLNGAGMSRAPELAVDLAFVAPYLRRALAACRREGIAAQRFTGETAPPPCLADDPAASAAEYDFPQEHIRRGGDFRGELGGIGRAKAAACAECPHDARCSGVPAEYARAFGLAALGPGAA